MADKLMPVDPDPVPDGNLELFQPPGAMSWRARVVPAGQGALLDEPRHKSHFATCPKADDHRAPRR